MQRIERNSNRCSLTILVIMIAMAGSDGIRWIAATEPVATTNAPNVDHAVSLSQSFRAVTEYALPILVTVHTPDSSAVQKENFPPLQVKDASSGFIVDSGGIIITNHHVIEGAEAVIVRLADGREFQTADIRSDPRSDLAIIRIDGAEKLPQAKLGNSDDIHVCDWTIVVRNPFGLGPSVTTVF